MAQVARDLPDLRVAPMEKWRIRGAERDHPRVRAWQALAGRPGTGCAVGVLGVGRMCRRSGRCRVALHERRVPAFVEHVQGGALIGNTDLDMRRAILPKSGGRQLELVKAPGMGIDELVEMSEIF